MPVAGAGRALNARGGGADLLVIATGGRANDKQQLQPMLNKVTALPDELGEAETMLADRLLQRGECGGLRGGEIEPHATGANRISARPTLRQHQRRRTHRSRP